MSLTGAINIARTGLLVNQSALEVTGQNMANAATKGYSRQTAVTSPLLGVEIKPGVFLGRGVALDDIVRHVDEALNTRLRSAVADQHASEARQDLLRQIESVHNELNGAGLSTQLSKFFNAFSELTVNGADSGLRTLAISQGRQLASFIGGLGDDLNRLRDQVERAIGDATTTVNNLLDQIQTINRSITGAEGGQGGGHGLRDARDRVLAELSRYLDISTVDLPNGEIDVFVGSTPLMLAGENRGVNVDYASVNGQVQVTLRVAEDNTPIPANSGRIGQLIESRNDDVIAAVDTLNTFAGQLIFQVNRLHSQGQGEQGFSTLTGTYRVDDTTVPLTDALTELPFTPGNGSFTLHVTQKSTGTRASVRIDVNLDGIGADTSLEDLAASIDAVANVSATITPQKTLNITSDSGDFAFTFSDDTSGVLAALGLNTYFVGRDATDIDVNPLLTATAAFLATRRGHEADLNGTAQAIADLQNTALSELEGLSLRAYWTRHVEDYAIRTAATDEAFNARSIVAEALEAQRQGVSGVNIDEEAINLIGYQRAFQGSARFISVIDQLMETLLAIVR